MQAGLGERRPALCAASGHRHSLLQLPGPGQALGEVQGNFAVSPVVCRRQPFVHGSWRVCHHAVLCPLADHGDLPWYPILELACVCLHKLAGHQGNCQRPSLSILMRDEPAAWREDRLCLPCRCHFLRRPSHSPVPVLLEWFGLLCQPVGLFRHLLHRGQELLGTSTLVELPGSS